MKHSKLHGVWKAMRQRCSNQNNKSWKDYGGRGIKTCLEWNKFDVFYCWAVSNGYKEGLQIDRIDNDKGYYPENCRWVKQRRNRLNRRRLQSSNKSGYEGINKRTNSEKWRARISIEGNRINLGDFEDIKQAVLCRNKYIKEHGLELDYKIQEV